MIQEQYYDASNADPSASSNPQQIVQIQESNLKEIKVDHENVRGLDVDEFNRRANEMLRKMFNPYIGQTMTAEQATYELNHINEQACIQIFDQMVAEQNQEDSEE